jgi:DNA-binding MarR family transcriptional regulator
MPANLIPAIFHAARELDRSLQPLCRRNGVTITEAHLLAHLRIAGPCRTGELQRLFGFKPSTFTSVLDRLANKRMITRKAHPKDRRLVLIALTGEGRAIADRLQQTFDRTERTVSTKSQAGDFGNFSAVLAALTRNSTT